MNLQQIQKIYSRHAGVKALARELGKPSFGQLTVSGLQGSAAPLVFASLAELKPEILSRPYLFVLDDEEDAGYFYHDLVQFLGDGHVLFFPSSYKRAIRFGQKDPANEILRTEVLSRLSAGALPLFIVTHPQALAEKVVTKEVLEKQTLSIGVGESVDIMFVQETLLDYGFRMVDYVYEPGQFSIRGSIVDVYSYSCESPYRIDFFGDEVDSIRTFDVQSQLSKVPQKRVSIVPELSGQSIRTESFLKFLPANTILVSRDIPTVCQSVAHIYQEGFSSQALLEEQTMMDSDDGHAVSRLNREEVLVDSESFNEDVQKLPRIEIKAQPSEKIKKQISFQTHPQPIFHKNFDLLSSSFREYLNQNYDLYIFADSTKQTERLESIFYDKETGIHFIPVDKTLHAGFFDEDLKVCFFTDHQIFDRFHKYNLKSEKARNGKVALTLKELQQFEVGDYVVHVDHGVGRFGGLVRIPNGDHMQEVIKIIYQRNDAIFVSIHSLHKVSKYKGKEGEPPRISTLGTGAWERMKERTKAKIKDIARDLIKLYSRRREEKGFAFSPDNFMQHELEASFLYEDTPDQLKATQDVKSDMESARPMDRLVCGDVGFGKTEVAIRAAFKACSDNKQVAVLVPTTVLAYQHYRTFSDRLRNLPVCVEYLSRARSAQQTKQILERLKSGEINIIIGTHKLISKSVKFNDLGLLIIDEEQKFGVSTKEKLRQLKTNVDTLTLTATPIPRTLQFSLMGARDLSVIQTPPPNRYPIQTQLCQFSGEVLAEAINFEMSRNGQVFIVNNRIGNLPDIEALIHKYVPDARVAVGHGQMPPERLEEIMIDFANYDYDVLLSTTIIESGLDIPNANTIVILGAHNFGLSDLHQMRGRVGRSNRKAFCYLVSPPLSSLNVDARRRLSAIENFSDLGSGIHIAMQDLDIRGAGNLLGAEQSGFIADLGYETYQKILSEAVRELQNDEFNELFSQEEKDAKLAEGSIFVDDCVIESDVTMSFPESYVPTSSERMLLYRELDGLKNDEEVELFTKRLKDRFGPVPVEGEELIRVVSLKALSRYFGIERLVLKANRMRLCFVTNPDSPFYMSKAFGRIISFATANIHRCVLEEQNNKRSLLVYEVSTVKEAVAILQQIKACSVT